MCVDVCVCARVWARVGACGRACVCMRARACLWMRACVCPSACVCVNVCVWDGDAQAPVPVDVYIPGEHQRRRSQHAGQVQHSVRRERDRAEPVGGDAGERRVRLAEARAERLGVVALHGDREVAVCEQRVVELEQARAVRHQVPEPGGR